MSAANGNGDGGMVGGVAVAAGSTAAGGRAADRSVTAHPVSANGKATGAIVAAKAVAPQGRATTPVEGQVGGGNGAAAQPQYAPAEDTGSNESAEDEDVDERRAELEIAGDLLEMQYCGRKQSSSGLGAEYKSQDMQMQNSCWGQFPSNHQLQCDPRYIAGTLHFKKKFCNACRECIIVPADRVRALTQAQMPFAINRHSEGFWNRAPPQLGSRHYRVVNNTATCKGPWLAIYRGVPPPLDWAQMPTGWVEDGRVSFCVAKGTLAPAVSVRGRSGNTDWVHKRPWVPGPMDQHPGFPMAPPPMVVPMAPPPMPMPMQPPAAVAGDPSANGGDQDEGADGEGSDARRQPQMQQQQQQQLQQQQQQQMQMQQPQMHMQPPQMQQQYNSLLQQYNNLNQVHQHVQSNHMQLQQQYAQLMHQHQQLQHEYQRLQQKSQQPFQPVPMQQPSVPVGPFTAPAQEPADATLLARGSSSSSSALTAHRVPTA